MRLFHGRAMRAGGLVAWTQEQILAADLIVCRTRSCHRRRRHTSAEGRRQRCNDCRIRQRDSRQRERLVLAVARSLTHSLTHDIAWRAFILGNSKCSGSRSSSSGSRQSEQQHTHSLTHTPSRRSNSRGLETVTLDASGAGVGGWRSRVEGTGSPALPLDARHPLSRRSTCRRRFSVITRGTRVARAGRALSPSPPLMRHPLDARASEERRGLLPDVVVCPSTLFNQANDAAKASSLFLFSRLWDKGVPRCSCCCKQ